MLPDLELATHEPAGGLVFGDLVSGGLVWGGLVIGGLVPRATRFGAGSVCPGA